ncbi:MAG: hypothetical protein RBS56_04405, partial [Candidatus Gracilibacteria bacterium]|nr:hypothetical protein [Candidatus Gracilibacteria bacterium]
MAGCLENQPEVYEESKSNVGAYTEDGEIIIPCTVPKEGWEFVCENPECWKSTFCCVVDGFCDSSGTENKDTCPADCDPGPICGDGTCAEGETVTNCPADCNPGPICGDGTCAEGETVTNCPADCNPGPVCGDGTCAEGETVTNCPADC